MHQRAKIGVSPSLRVAAVVSLSLLLSRGAALGDTTGGGLICSNYRWVEVALYGDELLDGTTDCNTILVGPVGDPTPHDAPAGTFCPTKRLFLPRLWYMDGTKWAFVDKNWIYKDQSGFCWEYHPGRGWAALFEDTGADGQCRPTWNLPGRDLYYFSFRYVYNDTKDGSLHSITVWPVYNSASTMRGGVGFCDFR